MAFPLNGNMVYINAEASYRARKAVYSLAEGSYMRKSAVYEGREASYMVAKGAYKAADPSYSRAEAVDNHIFGCFRNVSINELTGSINSLIVIDGTLMAKLTGTDGDSPQPSANDLCAPVACGPNLIFNP